MGKQPTMGQKKSKDAIARAAAASRKGAKKKWSKGKVTEKSNLDVLVDPKKFKEIEKDIPKMKLITLSTVSDRFKVTLSLARQIIRYFAEQNKITALDFQHQQCPLYTGNEKKEKTEETEAADKKGAKKGGKKEQAPKEEKAAVEAQ